ncbi:MAG: SGNH/GDSL hydrolase family protein, partial [Lachnospiraceae bacterium]|nr:SGNH/GDSL hydrolase family protein [Lachnospiraceae bacterium]
MSSSVIAGNGGPKAPKDPTKKRPGFCIMRDKRIAASPMPDGTGCCFIFESDGRLLDSARLVGGVTDESVIDLLKAVDSFKKLVHSIGVIIDADDGADVKFAFQMYGKSNPYVSGTTIEKVVTGDGMEAVIPLSEVEWSDDDKVPGQIRFHFNKGGSFANVTVRFYLNDGFDAPAEEDDNPVRFDTPEYAEIIGKSLMNKGNNVRIKRALEKARKGEDVTIGFIGGSITQGAGAVPINTECYAYKTFQGFCNLAGRGYEDNVHYIKAGIGGTPSELGLCRYERDVLRNGTVTPDVVVVEFAVNDEGDETKGECYDSLVRKIYNGPGSPAVMLIFAVFSNDWNLQDRLSPVGFAYNLPMVSTLNSVVEQFALKGDKRVVKKSQFFYDCYHPTNIGHRIMADGIINLLKLVDADPVDATEVNIDLIEPPLGGEFEKTRLYDRASSEEYVTVNAGSFADTDEVVQY